MPTEATKSPQAACFALLLVLAMIEHDYRGFSPLAVVGFQPAV